MEVLLSIYALLPTSKFTCWNPIPMCNELQFQLRNGKFGKVMRNEEIYRDKVSVHL